MIVLVSLDYGFNESEIILRKEWPFVHVVFIFAMAYLAGQIIAVFASILLEHWTARRILRPPVAVMLNLGKPVFGERFIGRWIVGRHYESLTKNMRSIILTEAAKHLGREIENINDSEDVFQVAFPVARTVPDAATRMDNFLKMYGFSRNVALSGLIGVGALLYQSRTSDGDGLYWWALLAAICSIIMFGRFLKFYVAYGKEVLCTYAWVMAERAHKN